MGRFASLRGTGAHVCGHSHVRSKALNAMRRHRIPKSAVSNPAPKKRKKTSKKSCDSIAASNAAETASESLVLDCYTAKPDETEADKMTRLWGSPPRNVVQALLDGQEIVRVLQPTSDSTEGENLPLCNGEYSLDSSCSPVNDGFPMQSVIDYYTSPEWKMSSGHERVGLVSSDDKTESRSQEKSPNLSIVAPLVENVPESAVTSQRSAQTLRPSMPPVIRSQPSKKLRVLRGKKRTSRALDRTPEKAALQSSPEPRTPVRVRTFGPLQSGPYGQSPCSYSIMRKTYTPIMGRTPGQTPREYREQLEMSIMGRTPGQTPREYREQLEMSMMGRTPGQTPREYREQFATPGSQGYRMRMLETSTPRRAIYRPPLTPTPTPTMPDDMRALFL